MTTTPQNTETTTPGAAMTPRGTARTDAARDHLWMHFTRHSTYEQGGGVPGVVRGDGAAAPRARPRGRRRRGGLRRPALPGRALRLVPRSGGPRAHRARRGRR